MSGYVGANSVAEKIGKLYWGDGASLAQAVQKAYWGDPRGVANCGISWAHHWGTVRWAERCTSM